MKIVFVTTLAVAVVAAVWALGGAENAPPPPAVATAPVPRDDTRNEGQIALGAGLRLLTPEGEEIGRLGGVVINQDAQLEGLVLAGDDEQVLRQRELPLAEDGVGAGE